MAGELPAAVSVTDELLHALVDEVRGLRADLRGQASVPQPGAAPGDARPDSSEVELTEPKPARSRAQKKR